MTKVAKMAQRIAIGRAPDKIETRGIDILKEHPKNSRRHSQKQIDSLVNSIETFGVTFPILIDKKNQILAHTGMWKAAKQRGMSDVPVIVARGWPEARKRAYIIADNRLAELSTWDKALLGKELAELRETGFDLGILGFSASEVASMIGSVISVDGDPENVPALPKRPTTVNGDLWLLGTHRVFCGDATLETDAKMALHGETADLCLTDPPYGVGIAYTKFADTREEVSRIAALWVPIARKLAKLTVFSCGVTRQWLYPEPDWVIGWFFAAGPLSSVWGFSCWQPFLCYGKDPSLSAGRGRRPDATSLTEINQKWVDMNTPANAADINHPCPKPVSLWQWMLRRLTMKAGELIFDPFLGSGTTIIVAEMEGRRCAGLEIDPAYCDVVVERWQSFTGRQATHAVSGKTFDEIKKARHGKAKDAGAGSRRSKGAA